MKVIKKAFIDLQEDEKNFMKEIVIFRSLVSNSVIYEYNCVYLHYILYLLGSPKYFKNI